MRRRSFRPVALGMATLAIAGTASVLGATGAQAAAPGTAGTMTANPATGTNQSSISFTTSAPCPAGTNITMFLAGQGFPSGFVAVGNSPISIYQTAPGGGITVPLTQTPQQYASQAGFTTLSGAYVFTLVCHNALSGVDLGDFTGELDFGTATAYTSPSNAAATTTTLAVTPAGSAQQGAAVALTATVSPNAAGTVQFLDGTTAIGAPVTVSNGTATLTTSTLSVGSHNLTAAFTPADPTAFQASTSAAVAYTVSRGPATPTTTALAVGPGSSTQQYSPVNLTATVSPAAAGTVQFLDGTTAIGAPVTVSNGTATLSTSTLSVGTHNLTAAFTPADPTAFAASTSAAVAYQVTPFTGSSASETITTTVNPGTLVISVTNNQVTLPSPTLNAQGDLFTTGGGLQPVTVTDSRAGNPGWTVSGQVTDFSDGAGHGISGQDLGWTPSVVDFGQAQTVTPGAAVAPAAVGTGDNGTAGLKSPRTLATGTGLGTSHLGAALALNVPTSTVAGTYSATLTLTAI